MKFTIRGRLSGLNEYTKANRSNHHAGNKMKKDNEERILWAIRQAKAAEVDKYPITLEIVWYEPNLRRDIDNVVFAQKFILDAMVKSGIIKNDSQKFVKGISHIVLVDKVEPRVEVEIKEGRTL